MTAFPINSATGSSAAGSLRSSRFITMPETRLKMIGLVAIPRKAFLPTLAREAFLPLATSISVVITGRSKVECKLMIRNKGTVASSPKAINTMGMPSRTVFGKVLVKPCMALSPKSRRSKLRQQRSPSVITLNEAP